MSSMNDSLCCGCLVTGRRVWPLRDSGVEDFYTELAGEAAPDLSSWGALCWQCRHQLIKFKEFRSRVREAAGALRIHLLQDPALNSIEHIIKTPQLRTTIAHNIDSTVLEEPVKSEPCNEVDKVEFEFIKSEDQDTFQDSIYEPDTFADSIEEEITPESPKQVKGKKGRKQKEKPKKDKKEKRVKKKEKTVRKRRKIDAVSVESDVSDGLTDLESVAEYYEEPVAAVEEEKQKEKKKPKAEVDYDPSEVKLITLSHEEMLKERESERLSDYYAKCPHQCTDCILGFKYQRTLRTHIETRHSESAGKHCCPTCMVRFVSASELAEHERLHLQRYKCTVCGKRFPTALAAVKHVRNHKEYKCELCSHVSGSVFRHQTHMSRAHRERPQCAECGKVFSSRKTYRYHINVIHKGQNRFPCPHCGKIYQWKSNLWRHIKNHKARDSGELYCEPCDKRFSSIATYQQHLKISRKHVTEEEFNYMCSDCGKKFANKTRLKDHVDWEHLKKINYRCDTCNKPFKSNTSLYVHMQNVHRNKDEKDNLCHVCGKSYQNIAKLKYHIVAMHTTDTPYTCEQCPSAFSWYSSLYRHIKEVHEKVKVKKKRPRRKDGAGEEAPPPAPPPAPPHLLSLPPAPPLHM